MNLNIRHQPRKRFGQNFLQDPFIIQKILHTVNPAPQDKIVEIGPGLGALTKPLLDRVEHLAVIEIDTQLAQHLETTIRNPEQLTIHIQDVLRFNFNHLTPTDPAKKLRVIGNLPYNISTPLLFHLLNYAHLIEDMYFMLQKEVVDRLTAVPRQKAYGRLSIMVQYFCKLEALFTVEPQAFYPVPKVQSAFVYLKPYLTLPYPTNNFPLFQAIVRTAFNQRRKNLANALKPYLTLTDFTLLKLDPQLRPEALSIAEFVQISNFINMRLAGTLEDQ